MRYLLTFVLCVGLTACGGGDDDGMGMGGGGAPDAGMGPDAGASAAYMEMCDPDTDPSCDDDLVCFEFNSRGPHCTHDCTIDDDCPSPSRGCNNMGVCKAP